MLIFNFSVKAGETITISTGEWTPYISQKLKHDGVVTHIVSDAFASQGIEVKYKFLPWIRAMREAKTGNVAASIIWSKSEERQQKFYYSEPVMPKKVVYFHLKSYDFDWKTLADLEGITIGGTRGYWYAELYQPLIEAGKITVEWVKSDEANLKKLQRGRIKVVPIDIGAGYAMIQKEFPPLQQKLFTHHPKLVNEPNYNHLIMPKSLTDSPRLMKAFNKGLKQLKESGQFEQYYENSQKGDYNLPAL